MEEIRLIVCGGYDVTVRFGYDYFGERRNLNYIRKFQSFARRNAGIRLYDGGYSVRSGYGEQVKRQFVFIAVHVVSDVIYGISAFFGRHESAVFNADIARARCVLFVSDDVIGKSSDAVIVVNFDGRNDYFFANRNFIFFFEIVGIENRA